MKRLILFVTLLSAMQCFAQSEYVTPLENFRKGIKQYDKGKYSESIKMYDKVSENDSLYYTALYEKTLALYQLEKYNEALDHINHLLAITPEPDVTYDIVKANILDDMERYDEAQAIFEGIAFKQPFNQNAWFNLGVSYFKSKDYDKAEGAFIKSVILKPWHFRSNLLLGLCNGMMGRPVHAIVCINMAALLNAEDEFGLTALSNLESFTDGAFDDDIVAGKYTTPDSITSDKIRALEPIISSHVIGKNKMKLPTKNTYSITKYNYVVFSELENMPGNNIYTQYYFPFFKAVFDKGFFDVYSYYIMQSVSAEQIQSYLKKKKSKILAFGKWVSTDLGNRIKSGNGMRPSNVEYNYTNGSLSNVSTYADSTKKVLEGMSYEIQSNGVVESEGMYKNDIPVGVFYVYYPDGTLNIKLEYLDEEETSLLTVYETNGVVIRRVEMKKGKKDGRYEDLFPDGKTSGVYMYKDDKFTGEAYMLYSNGDTAAIDIPLADSIHFEVKLFFHNGKLKGNYIRTKDEFKFDGMYREYWSNGNPSIIAEMKDELFVGDYYSFLMSGDTAKIMHFDSKGKSIGTDREFGTNGKLIGIREHIKTNETYNFKEFTQGDKVVFEMRVSDDKFVSVVQYDTTGKEINRLENLNKGASEYSLVNIYTGKTTLNNTLKNGQRQGKSTRYTHSGTLSSESNYTDDKLDGKYTVYYPNGKVFYYYHYKEGEKDGKYEGYYPNEKIEATGYYYNDHKVGSWYFYNPDGSLSRSEYYQQSGNQNGLEIQYANDSLVVFIDKYVDDNLKSSITLGPDGDTLYQYEVPIGMADVKLNYKNGRLMKSFHIVDYQIIDSVKTFYPDGTLATEAFYIEEGLDGQYKSYYPNGKLESMTENLDGEFNGKDIEYNPDGTTRYETSYNDGEENSSTIYYHYNNKISSNIPNTNDAREGNADYFSPEGEFMFRLIYFNNNLVAYTWMDKNKNMLPPVMVDKDTVQIVTYYANGTKSSECTLVGGERQGDRFFYYPSGKIMEKEHYECGRLDGTDTYYRADGTKVSELNYSYGDKHGLCTYFHSNGKPMIETEYFYGDENGAQKIYSADGKLISTYIYFGGVLIETR